MTRLRRVARVLVGVVVILLVLLGLTIGAVETGWAKNQLRRFLVRQANEYLTATLEIGSLGGSLLRSVELDQVRLTQNGRTLIAIDAIDLHYSIRELLQPGVVIRRVRLVRPRIVTARRTDGRWELGAIIKRERREQQRTGPGRPIQVQRIEIADGRVTLEDPLDLGAAHIPTDFNELNAAFSFAYFPVRWELTFDKLAWMGSSQGLTVNSLTGTFGRGPNGWFFQELRVVTPRSAFTMRGTIDTEIHPTQFDLQVSADRFAFQEWSGVLHGLRDIAVDSSFETSLKGPARALRTDLRLTGTGGAIRGQLTLDTTVPGWTGAGAVEVERLELGHWLNRPDRPSDITGRVTFDLALGFGQHVPRGSYRFDGPHAMYMHYAADGLRAEGHITATAVVIARANATAYGATVSLAAGSIGLENPYPYRFAGRASAVDLRRVPLTVPVPHVESTLAFDYDVSGRFSRPFIAGRAEFGPSEFLGATIGAGTVGTIDTSEAPVRYTGDGTLSDASIPRLGEGLDVAWMRDPRYTGRVSGRFHVDGAGSDRDTLVLSVDGRLTHADLFHGEFADADVSMSIAHGTLQAAYDGGFSHVDSAIPFDDDRFAANLSGTGHLTATVRNLLTADHLTLDDYEISGGLSLAPSVVRGFRIDRGAIDAALRDQTLSIARLEVEGPAAAGTGSGRVTFAEPASVDFSYNATRLDLAELTELTGLAASGAIATKGRATGAIDAPRLAGDASASNLDAYNIQALTLTSTYDLTLGGEGHLPEHGRMTANGSFVTLFGTAFHEVTATATYNRPTLTFDGNLSQSDERQGRIAGTVDIAQPRDHVRALTVADLTVALGSTPWHLASGPATLTWTDAGIELTPMSFTAAAGSEARLDVSGSWRTDGGGALVLRGSHLFLESLQRTADRPARFGGVLDAEVTLRGTREQPSVAATATITNGRVGRITYQQLTARVQYADRLARVNLRLDQAPGFQVTADGTVPLAYFNDSVPDGTIDLTVKSTPIKLGLLEGITSVVRDVGGDGQFDVRVTGTGRHPRFDGSVSLTGARFTAAATGSKYKNANAAIRLAGDRLAVDSLHVEDSGGHVLTVSGSLGTQALRVGDVQLDATAKHFEVLRNELGRIDIDAALSFRGTLNQPRVTGDLTIDSGDLRVDEVLARTLFQPYATSPTEVEPLDAVAALNPWERLSLDVALGVPETLRLTGSNIQISQGTPIGMSDINLRVGGDLYLYKGSGDELSVNGSLDSVSGAFGFQGRRFDVDESASSINFEGDLNPEIFVSVTRQIAGVDTRVTVAGPLKQPELQLSSVPPLDASDILSLVVFNTSTNQLSPNQQQELVVRAGTLAAGFLAAPIVSAIQQEIGLQVLDVEPSTDVINAGPRLTVGQEIAPRLLAQFSRQFGQEPYDEATIEYYLSRILRLRATFSDAQSLEAISPFRRVERAGIDLMVFLSF